MSESFTTYPHPSEPIGSARRANYWQAKHHFENGGTIIVSEFGHQKERDVYPSTTLHTQSTILWEDLVDMVRLWKNRYPNQRYYIVTFFGSEETD